MQFKGAQKQLEAEEKNCKIKNMKEIGNSKREKEKKRVPLKHWIYESCNTLQVVETHESNSVNKGREDQFLQTFFHQRESNNSVEI